MQAKDSPKLTSGTSGPHSSISSASAALSASLASKLKARLEKVGSMEYRQTWKEKATPLGVSYWAHTASGHRTSAKDCSGWLTPQEDNANNAYGHKGTSYSDLPTTAQMAGWATPSSEGSAGETSEDLERRGNKWVNRKTGRVLQTNLATDVKMLVGWHSPKADTGGHYSRVNGKDYPTLEGQAKLAGWATPRAEDGESAGMRHSRGVADTLTAQAGQGLAGWPTPDTQNHRDGNCTRKEATGAHAMSPHHTAQTVTGWPTSSVRDSKGGYEGGRMRDGKISTDTLDVVAQLGIPSTSSPAGTEKRGALNPAHSRWLMGFPVTWCQAAIRAYRKLKPRRKAASRDSAATATPSSRKSRQSS